MCILLRICTTAGSVVILLVAGPQGVVPLLGQTSDCWLLDHRVSYHCWVRIQISDGVSGGCWIACTVRPQCVDGVRLSMEQTTGSPGSSAVMMWLKLGTSHPVRYHRHWQSGILDFFFNLRIFLLSLLLLLLLLFFFFFFCFCLFVVLLFFVCLFVLCVDFVASTFVVSPAGNTEVTTA